MNLTSIASAASGSAAASTNENVALLVQRKAMDVESQNAMALIAAVSNPPNLPPNLGRNINTTA